MTMSALPREVYGVYYGMSEELAVERCCCCCSSTSCCWSVDAMRRLNDAETQGQPIKSGSGPFVVHMHKLDLS